MSKGTADASASGINIVVAPPYARRVSQKELRTAVTRVLKAEKHQGPGEVSIVIVGDRAMKDYNRRFHHVNSPTDVLSFDAPSGEDYLGDIIISYDTAKENARRAKWRVRQELELLVTHGILHLLGYDDTTPPERERMWARQAKILARELKM